MRTREQVIDEMLVGTVKSRLYAARERLRAILEV
jgi:DNA-directed RNA polymerase specialized sigma24 family protein